jgi:hypothetical protein
MVKVAKAAARIQKHVCVTSKTLRFGNRSTKAPANKEKNSMGNVCNVVTMPNLYAELFVSSRTSHPWPTFCVHVPTKDTA